MSGGSLDYFYSRLEEHVGDFGDKELDSLIKDLVDLFYEREWYLSGDTCEGRWNEARDKFKKKWFTEQGRTERIEQCLDEFKAEMLQSFGATRTYCQDCKHWKKEKDSAYGDCDLHKGCMYHRCETCKDWEKRHEDT